ncbi:MAG TPA: glycosyltransferase [Pseudomonadales bacterium]|nr:glycosyltransferase [Pseudomonadales bacterium]
MKFSIITPSFRNSEWLKLCIASVADQNGVEKEHIVQDSCSDDGTQDWLPRDPRVWAFIERDAGMYDAVNRGFRRAQGDLLAYLNCDEQYLPGALMKVVNFFQSNPNVDVVFGDCIVVDGKGNYLCERRVLVPQLPCVQVSGNLSFFTAATFLRRRVIDQYQLWFNPGLRDVGDAEWTLRLLKSRLRMAVLPQFISAFTETGHNMNLGANAMREKKEFNAAAPGWARMLRPFIVAHYRLRRWRAGYYQCKPEDYAIYTLGSPDRRKTFPVVRPTFRWVRLRHG